MNRNDLIRFIRQRFEEGKCQDEVRVLAGRYAITEEAYRDALLVVLSERLVEGRPRQQQLTGNMLILAGLLLVVAAVVLLTLLNGRYTVPLGGALLGLGVGAFVGARHQFLAGEKA